MTATFSITSANWTRLQLIRAQAAATIWTLPVRSHFSAVDRPLVIQPMMRLRLGAIVSSLLYLDLGCAYTPLRSFKITDSRNYVLFGLRTATTSEELLSSQLFRINGQWTADISHQGMRLSEFLTKIAPETFSSSTSSKNAIRRGLVRVNGCKASNRDGIKNEDVIESFIRSQQGLFCNEYGGKAAENPEAYDHCTVQVVWEDSHLAVVIKPQGMPVFRTKEIGSTLNAQLLDQSTEGSCLQSALPYSLSPVPHDSNLQPLRRPRAVHRLDAGTGGLILVAKTRPALISLTEQFAERTVSKSYRAIVVGKLDGNNGASFTAAEDTELQPVRRLQGSICDPLSGQIAETDWSVEPGMHTMSKTYGWITTVDLKPHTGRTHQLRR